MLTLHIEQGTVERTDKAITNFSERLPMPLSDLARESLKDPYRFDFLSLGAEVVRRLFTASDPNPTLDTVLRLAVALECNLGLEPRVVGRRTRKLAAREVRG